MVRIEWTSQAIEDLQNIKKYISQGSIFYARKTILEIRNSTSVLKKFNQIGRIVPEFDDNNVREIIQGNYRIIYFTSSKKIIQILTIVHSSRNLSRLNIIK